MAKVRLSPSVLAWARCFEAVVRCRSFTEAAADLCISQGAVSQQVRQLEEWICKPLLIRSSRGLTPTSEGRSLAIVLTESLRAIEGALAQIRVPDTSEDLLLSCSPSFAMSWLTPQLGEFYRLHPQIGLKVLAEFHALDAAKMKSNGLAAALRFDLGEYHDLVAHQILDEFLVPVATPRFLAEHPGIRSPGDLEGHYLLHDSESWSGAKASTEWEHWLEGAKVNIAPASMKLGHQFNLSILATAATVADQGIGMGRLSLVLNDLMTGRLCAPFPLYIRSRASYHFVTSSRSPPEVEIVRTWILGRVQEFQRARDTFLARMTQLPY